MRHGPRPSHEHPTARGSESSARWDCVIVYGNGKSGTKRLLRIFDLSPEGLEILDQSQLFLARATWSLPVLHRGLLYVSQHEPDFMTQAPARLICYDLRAENE